MELEKMHEKVPGTRQSQATFLPLDLISEILLRLPVKSAAKFRCVSKLWYSITTLPSFISSFAGRSSPRLLILSIKDNKLFFFSTPQNQNSDNKPRPVDRYVMTFTRPCPFLGVQSVHGLICIMRLEMLQIWNPTTKDVSTLPTPEIGWENTVNFLAHDPIDGTYKVLSIPSSPIGRIQPMVLTLNGAQKSWRVIQEFTKHFPSPIKKQYINGFVYYGASLKLDHPDSILVSFHVRSEKMSMIKLPYNLRTNTLLVPYHGKLACVISEVNDITIWILEDAEKHVWSYKNLHLPFPRFDPISSLLSVRLIGVNNAGELIYVPYKLANPFRILYFDPNRNSYRRVVIEGLTDGLGNNAPLRTFAVFSNQIETIMSL